MANSTLIACHQCPLGARCTGGDFVEAIDGFWRRDGAQAVEVFRCDPGKELLHAMNRYIEFACIYVRILY